MDESSTRGTRTRVSEAPRDAEDLRATVQPPTEAWHTTLGGFWAKLNNDWVFNLAGLLAYNFLFALFPILLLLLAGFGVLLNTLSPSTELQLEHGLALALPGNTGQIIVDSVLRHLRDSAGLLFVVGIVTSFIAGSRLFIALENCFGIIFRLRGRHPLQQNRMAFGMLLLYLVLVPMIFLAALLPADLVRVFDPGGRSLVGGLLLLLIRLGVSLLAGLLLFGVTYAFVPNRPVRWRTWQANWRGAIVGALLLLAYEALFPLYQQHFVRAENYGSIAVFAVAILLFFYYLALILLLGAEINSWAAGQRETAADIPGMLHAMQAHHTLRGAAGRTAGQPQEEMQQHKRARMIRYLDTVVKRVQRGYAAPLKLPLYRRVSRRPNASGSPDVPA